jgi:hypothetical protein
MVNWKKFFLFVGIPILAFYIFLIVIFFAFVSGLFILALIMGICCLRFSKKKIFPGLSKLTIAMMLVFLLFISNPLYWPEQIARHIDTSRVILPNDSLVQQLNSTDYMWDYLNNTYGVTPPYFYNNMTKDEQLNNMTDYILNSFEVINYTSIPAVYGVIDFTASAHDAIVHGRGDCQSQAAIMVSFFLFMGYDAWACEAPYHWYTLVYLSDNHTDPHFYNRQGWSDPQIILNNETKIYTMNLIDRLGDITFGRRFYDKIYELFSMPTAQIGLWPLLLVIGFLMTVAIRSTASEKKHILKNGILASIILIAGFFLALSFSQVFFPQLFIPQIVFIIMVGSVILAAQTVHSNLGTHLYTKK